MASWYGSKFHGRRTASGERYDMHQLTAAHPTLAFGTEVEVVHLANGKSVSVRINDRGPFAKGRIIDLSFAAAQAVDLVGPGTGMVALYVTGRSLPSYTVQIGAFSDYDRAVALHEQLAGAYPEVSVHSEGHWHRVQIGSFEGRDAAESLRRELAAIGFDGLIVLK
jgi:rare lipoprotein A